MIMKTWPPFTQELKFNVLQIQITFGMYGFQQNEIHNLNAKQ